MRAVLGEKSDPNAPITRLMKACGTRVARQLWQFCRTSVLLTDIDLMHVISL